MWRDIWTLIKVVFRDTHTNSDGVRYDWAKVAGSGSVAVYLYMCYHHLTDDNIFDPVQFATGLCAIIGTVCAGIAVKNATRPPVT